MHHLEVLKLIRVLSQAPRKHASEVHLPDEHVKLGPDRLGGIERPEPALLRVPVREPITVVAALGEGSAVRLAQLSRDGVVVGKSAGATEVRAGFGIFEKAGGTADAVAVTVTGAVDARGGEGPAHVKGEAEVEAAGVGAAADVGLEGAAGGAHARVVGGGGVAAVEQVVGHDVEEVEGGEDVGEGGVGEGEHVALETGHGGGEELGGAEVGAEGAEEEGVGGDFPGFLGVGDLFVVFAVAAVGVSLEIGLLFYDSVSGGVWCRKGE